MEESNQKPDTRLTDNLNKFILLKARMDAQGINVNHFYQVNVTQYEIRIQGKYTPEIRQQLKELGWCCQKSKGNKWMEKIKDGVDFTLMLRQ